MKRLLFILPLLVCFYANAQQPILRNAMTTNIAGTPVLSYTNLTVTNINSGTNWIFGGARSNTVARLMDIVASLGITASAASNIVTGMTSNYFIWMTNGFGTNTILDNPTLTNGVNYGNAFSSVGAGTRAEQFGATAVATNTDATAVGHGAVAGHTQSTAVGRDAYALRQSSTAIGNQAQAYRNSTAVGASSYAETNSTSVGVNAICGIRSISIGQSAGSFDRGIAIGVNSTTAGFSNAIVIGDSVTGDEEYQFLLGTSSHIVDIPGFLEISQNAGLNRVWSCTNATTGRGTWVALSPPPPSPPTDYVTNNNGWGTNMIDWGTNFTSIGGLTVGGASYLSNNLTVSGTLTATNAKLYSATPGFTQIGSQIESLGLYQWNPVLQYYQSDLQLAENALASPWGVMMTDLGDESKIYWRVEKGLPLMLGEYTGVIISNNLQMGNVTASKLAEFDVNRRLTNSPYSSTELTNPLATITYTDTKQYGCDNLTNWCQISTNDFISGTEVSNAIASQTYGQTWYVWGSSNAIATNGAGVAYKAMWKSDITIPTTANTNTYVNPSVGTYIGEVITAIPAGISSITPGEINTVSFMYLNAAGSVTVEPEIYIRTNNLSPDWTLSEREIGVGPPIIINNTAPPVSYVSAVPITTNVSLSTSNFLVRKFKVTANGTSRNVSFVSQGSYPARVTFPIGSASFVLKSGDTMSGNLVMNSGQFVGDGGGLTNILNLTNANIWNPLMTGMSYRTNAAVNGSQIDISKSYQYTNAAGAVTFIADLLGYNGSNVQSTVMVIGVAAVQVITIPAAWRVTDGVRALTVSPTTNAILSVTCYPGVATNAAFKMFY